MNYKFIVSAFLFIVSVFALNAYPEQSQFYYLFSLYSLAFGSFLLVLRNTNDSNFRLAIAAGVIVRLLLVFLFPNMSDDIYRFFWDGLLWSEGMHPLAATPTAMMNEGVLSNPVFESIYPLLNSKEYHTVYPPVCQWFFYLCSWVGDISIAAICFKALFLISEVLTLIGIIKLLSLLDKPKELSLLFFLNPLIITEFTGNLHFENLMLCAFIWCCVFIKQQKFLLAGVCYALSILTKLVPLVFGPLLLLYLWKDYKAMFTFFGSSGLLVLAGLFFLFYGIDVMHFADSLDLYFRSFEFNASFYYLFREVGILISGYNQIALIGPFLAMLSLFSILYVSWTNRKSYEGVLYGMFWIFLCYILLSTTVHPWYISSLLILGLFQGKWVVPILFWSYLIYLSYSAYDTDPVQEHLAIIAIEYLVLIGMLIYMSRVEIKKLFPRNAERA